MNQRYSCACHYLDGVINGILCSLMTFSGLIFCTYTVQNLPWETDYHFLFAIFLFLIFVILGLWLSFRTSRDTKE